MKDKRGFTLVELLATIAILAILAVIATVSVESILNRGKNDATKIQDELVEAAAKQYAVDECSDTCEVTINELINLGYIDEKKGTNLDKSKTLYISINKNSISVNYSNKLKDLILGENNENVNKNAPNFSSSSIDNGLFVQQGDSTKSINGQATYYYRGDVKNNYVEFGVNQKDSRGYRYDGKYFMGFPVFAKTGEPSLWRIVRINEDGSIRLISESLVNLTDNKWYAFNSNGNSSYIGSSIQTAINNWFTSFLNIDNNPIVISGTFCNDISGNYTAAKTRITNKNPSFVCPSTANIVKAKVGMITADEVMFAGGLTSKITNNTTYLENLTKWYTMTPYSSTSVYAWISGSSLFLSSYTVSSSSAYARMVINISANATVKKGNGSEISPYVIE